VHALSRPDNLFTNFLLTLSLKDVLPSRSPPVRWRNPPAFVLHLDAALDRKRQKDGGKNMTTGHFSAPIFLP
jgi:hypothetical protein